MTAQQANLSAFDGGSFMTYLATPNAARAPGLVLIQYICGVNKVMREIADDFAARGFLVAVPDLFWRQEPNIQLNNDPAAVTPEEHARSLELNAGFDDDLAVEDLKTTIAFLRRHPNCSGRVGALGYCLGGRLAYLVASRADCECAVGYYGVNIDQYLDECGNIGLPLMLHIAADDALCSAEAHDAIVGALGEIGRITLHEYDDANHAFALVGGPHYDAGAADRANDRSYSFLKEHLA